jgi:hypothetical protein
MSRRRRWSCCLAIGLAAVGCGRDSTRVAPPGAAPADADTAASEAEYRVVLGTGVRDYQPLADDEHATLIAGPQGAYHVWISFLSYGFDADALRMQIWTRWDDAPGPGFEMHGDVAARPGLDAQGQSVRRTLSWPALVEDPLCQDGRALRVELSVSDGQHSASDTRRWILDVAEMYRPVDCTAGDVGAVADADASAVTDAGGADAGTL